MKTTFTSKGAASASANASAIAVNNASANANVRAPLAPVTDSNVSKVYQHWADGDAAMGTDAEWNNNILSANKSDYFEGEVVPNIFYYSASNKTPLVQGQSYSFNVTYNYYQGTSNAGGYAYMTTYNIDRQPGTLTGATPSADPVAPANNRGGMQGQFYSVNADVTSVSEVTYTQKGGNIDATVTVTFTYTGPTTNSGGAEIYYGLMVAQPGMVPSQGNGPTDGAAAWTGGSLQTTVDIGGSGATSIQLAPSAIIVGEISGMKFEDVNGDGARDADGVDNIAGNADDEAGVSGWTIFLDTNDNGALDAGERSTLTDASGLYVFAVTPDADPSDPDNDPYLVREVQQMGWVRTTTNPGPILIDALDPTETGVNFGNQRYLPSLRILKEASVDGGTADFAGEIISYTVSVENTGNQTLTGVTVTDPLVSNLTLVLDGASSDGELDVGETWQYTGTHAVTQAEIDSNGGGDGDIDNTATADSDQTGPSSDDAAVLVEQKPGLRILKEASVDGGTADFAGEIISYTVSVENTGNQTLTGVTVTDPLVSNLTLVLDGASSDGELDVGETWQYSGTHAVTQAEIDTNGGGDGDIDNTATADSDQTGPSSDDAAVLVEQKPALGIDKAVIGVSGGNGNANADIAGDVIRYSVLVYNPGNQTLTGVTVVDPFTGLDIDSLTLAPGESRAYETQYTLTQQDMDTFGGGNGLIENTATADSDQTGPVSASREVPLQVRPSLSINKVLTAVEGGNGNGAVDAAGDVLRYTIKVVNEGTVTLTGLRVTDDLTGLNADDRSLAPGESATFETEYVLTQTDIDNNGGGDGDIDNTATADSDQTDPVSDSESAALVRSISLGINKSLLNITGGNNNGFADVPGDVLNFSIRVYNPGSVTLTGVTIVDPQTGLSETLPSLNPGASQTLSTQYTLTQNDIDTNLGGLFDNVATADSDQTAAVSDAESVLLVRYPVLAFDKGFTGVSGGNGNNLADAPGDVLNYRFTLVNAGNVTQTNVRLSDPMTGLLEEGFSLAPGELRFFTASYTLTQADIDNNGGGDGYVDNTGTVRSNQSGPLSDSESVPIERSVALTFDEAFVNVTGGNDNSLADAAGDILNFRFVATNAGTVTLTNVRVQDVLTGLDQTIPTLAPGAQYELTASYVLTQADLDNNGGGDGRLDNTSGAQASPTVSASDSESVTLVYDPQIKLTKYVSVDNGVTWLDANLPPGPSLSTGNAPQFRFVVENVGNVTVPGVELTDSRYDLNGAEPGTAHMFGPIAVGDSAEWVFTGASYEAGLQSDEATAVVIGITGVQDIDEAYYTGV